ncbi:MAG: VWA domain-containing protein, partial [Planctomycetes bacterium]|nr:VWA domain-containing protein [Planctomycetota bacterium]
YEDADQRSAVEQLTGTTADSATRWQITLALLTSDNARLLRDLTGPYRVRVYRFSDQTTRIADLAKPGDVDEFVSALRRLSPAGSQTRPGAALRHVLDQFRGTPLAAVIVLSDGVTTTGPADSLAEAVATDEAPPVFAVGLGSPAAP